MVICIAKQFKLKLLQVLEYIDIKLGNCIHNTVMVKSMLIIELHCLHIMNITLII